MRVCVSRLNYPHYANKELIVPSESRGQIRGRRSFVYYIITVEGKLSLINDVLYMMINKYEVRNKVLESGVHTNCIV